MKRKLNPRVGERVYLPDDYDGRFNHAHIVAAVDVVGLTTIVQLVPVEVWERKRDTLTAARVLRGVSTGTEAR